MAVTEREAVEYALTVRARLLDQLGRPREAAEVRARVPRSEPSPSDARVAQLERQLAESQARISQLVSQVAALEAEQRRADRKNRGLAAGRRSIVTSHAGWGKTTKGDVKAIRKKA